MRLYTWLGIVVPLSLAPPVPFVVMTHAGGPLEPPSMAVQPPRLASDPEVRAYLADLLRLAGNGFISNERGAFLVSLDEGGYRCDLWPWVPGYQRTAFRGRIPTGTIAVIHTHPNSIPRPSTRDRHEARRLGLPFLVVSARHIFAITPRGEVTAIVDDEWWSSGSDRERAEGCRLIRDVAPGE